MNLYDIAEMENIENARPLRETLARMDERALCFDPDPEYRREIKLRMTEPELEKDQAA